MNTDDLILRLTQAARPVRRLPGPTNIALALASWSLILAVAASVVMGWRPDLAERLTDARFWLVAVLLLAICATGQGVLAALAIPRRRGFRPGATAGAVLLLLLAGVLLSRLPWLEISPWPRWLGFGLYCAGRAVLVSVLPIAGGWWLLRRGASVYPSQSGALLGLTAGLYGAFALQWSCDLVEPAHVLLWHLVVPGLLLGAAGAWIGSRWLRW